MNQLRPPMLLVISLIAWLVLAGGPAPARADTGSSDEELRWDRDPEQRAAAEEEFQVITDRTTEIQIEEMPAYWRLLGWVQEQSVEMLSKQARTDIVYNDLRQNPDRFRGQLLQLDLQVCRVLELPVPENSLGLRKVYEIWGRTQESGAWLYVGIAPELPPGFPIGSRVSQPATFRGYFFKLQGYLEGGAAPRAKPIGAPLLFGRVEWRPQENTGGTSIGGEVYWGFGLVVVFGALLASRLLWMVLRSTWGGSTRGIVSSSSSLENSLPTAEQWSQKVQQASFRATSADPFGREQEHTRGE